jgi:hypothetical protein
MQMGCYNIMTCFILVANALRSKHRLEGLTYFSATQLYRRCPYC